MADLDPLTAQALALLASQSVTEPSQRTLIQALLEDRRRLLQRLREQPEGAAASPAAEGSSSPRLLPLCYHCRGVRQPDGDWIPVEQFLSQSLGSVVSQSVCPTCIEATMTRLALPPRTSKLPSFEEEANLMQGLLGEGIPADHPLLARHLELARRYTKAARRLEKISKISDGFQSQLKELNHALQRASLTDPLTGIANRRAMRERLLSEANRSQRGGQQFSVLMLDLDHFKRINDTHGHEAGDLVIVAVAKTLESNLRNFDFCARWGGEEFLILLTGTDLETAAGVADKLRQAVSAHEVSYLGQRLPVTFSGGLATHLPGAEIDDTLRQADHALYAAKSGGRNRIELGAVR